MPEAMRLPAAPYSRFPRTPVIAGVFLCLCLALPGCERESATPDWIGTEQDPAAQHASPAALVNRSPAPGLRFMAYNVENWLNMERDGRQRAKPESEKAVVVRLIAENRPDVLGVCEIGERADVVDLQRRLKAAGWSLPHLSYDADSHALRRLALLSRHPITSTDQPVVREYRMQGRSWRMSRPILDATVEREGCRYRFVGVHLKSKREVRDADQEQMRVHEARLLRRHVEDILADEPATRLVVYGDFNDTLKSTAMKTVAGAYRSPTYLTAVPCGDSRGHRWTHHWEYQDVYSRFDYVLVSQGLKPEVDFRGSYLVDDPSWNKGSDHRPLVTIFRANRSK